MLLQNQSSTSTSTSTSTSISTLMYDVHSAQNQSMADTLVRMELKARLAEGSKNFPSDLPVYLPPSDPRSHFNIGDTPDMGQGSGKKKDKESREPMTSETITKDGTKAKITKVPSKGKSKSGKQKQMRISLQGRLIAAAEESLAGSDDPGYA